MAKLVVGQRRTGLARPDRDVGEWALAASCTRRGAMSAARDAERMVAQVRDDPAGRIRLAAEAYSIGRARRRYRPYRRAVVAFMCWQQRRGVLNAPDDGVPGSPWWRAVNEDLLRDTVEAKLLVQRGGGEPSRPSVRSWVSFFNAPSAQ